MSLRFSQFCDFCPNSTCESKKFKILPFSSGSLTSSIFSVKSGVVEHVADPAEFCKSLSALTVSNGATVISTINRSMRAYATAIVAAEYILHWLPKGTHQWSSFLTPEELVLILQRASISVEEMAGFAYDPLTGQWSLSDDIGINFIAFGVKTSQ
ncbi:putative methyltransferase [Helianthus annuus]|nr:putative methyltransferase [Helianthus annuus]